MSAPVLWIYFPTVIGVILYLMRRRGKWIQISGFLITFILTILAFSLAVGSATSLRFGLGLPSLVIKDSIPFLGARLIVGQEIRPQLILVYLVASIWFGCTVVTQADYLLIPIGLAFVGLTIAALAISPSIYASLLLGIAVLICIPILTPPGKPVPRGVRQFLTFQILGIGLILLANWSILFAAIQTDLQISYQVPVFVLGLGFALVLPLFPFHSWITSISGASKNFGTLFIFCLLPATNAFLILDSFSQLGIMDLELGIISILKTVAILMVGGAGVWSLFEDHLGRISGYLILQQIGSCLLALSLVLGESRDGTNFGLFVAQFLPFSIALAILAFSINIIDRNNLGLSLKESYGLMKQLPFASTGILIAVFSISGLPLLASFPINLAIWSRLEPLSPALALFGLIGKVTFLVVGLRLMVRFISIDPLAQSQILENRLQVLIIILGGVAIFIMGLFPNVYLNYLIKLTAASANAIP